MTDTQNNSAEIASARNAIVGNPFNWAQILTPPSAAQPGIELRGFGMVQGFDTPALFSATAERVEVFSVGMHLPNLIAVFTLERDEEGEMIFADTVGAMYGVGPDLASAFEDWLISAKELRERFQGCAHELHGHAYQQLNLLDCALSESKSIGGN